MPIDSCRFPVFLGFWILSAALPAGAASIQWEAHVDGPGEFTIARHAAADGAGDLVVSGVHAAGGVSECRTVKFNGTTGTIVWQRSIAIADANCETAALALDGAGNAIVASRTHAVPGSTTGSRTTKYAGADGTILWERAFGDPADGADELVAVAADASGHAIVTGRFVAGTEVQWRTIKYASAGGATLWERGFDGGAAGDDVPEALALDAAGNPVVAGSSDTAAAAPGLVTIKYDSASGAPLWRSDFPSPSVFAVNGASGIAIDGGGNVLVLGSVRAYASVLNAVAVTLKYAADDGALLWSATIEEVVPNERLKYGMIAVAPTGNVVVAATKWGAGAGDYDFRTVQYAGATGAVMWARTFHAGAEYANALALDGAGNPVVAGQGGPAADASMATVKYSAADGATAWEHRYNGTEAGYGTAWALASVPGSVFVAGRFVLPVDEGSLFRWQVLKVSDTPGEPRRTRLDFNADSRADFAFRHSDGTTAIWLMDGAATASITGIFDAGSGYAIVAVEDFDGNGTADILWRLPEGYAISLMDGATFVATAGILGVGTGWAPVLAGDFDGDGKSDLVVRHDDGTHMVFIMDGTSVVRSFVIIGPGSGWSTERAGDFDGDGKSDLVLRHASGPRGIALMDGFGATAVASLPASVAQDTLVQLADFDGDGRKDFLWASPDGAYTIWTMGGTSVRGVGHVLAAGYGWSVSLAADFDADGRDDVVIAHTDGRVGILFMLGREIASSAGILAAGTGWSVADARDTNGDGRADLLLRHASGVYAIGLFDGTAMPTAVGVVGPPWTLTP